MKRLAQELPPVGATVALVIGKLRAWDHKPGIWVDLTAPSPGEG
ncbi:hypothetical protein [Streptomyces sp. NPDC058297]